MKHKYRWILFFLHLFQHVINRLYNSRSQFCKKNKVVDIETFFSSSFIAFLTLLSTYFKSSLSYISNGWSFIVIPFFSITMSFVCSTNSECFFSSPFLFDLFVVTLYFTSLKYTKQSSYWLIVFHHYAPIESRLFLNFIFNVFNTYCSFMCNHVFFKFLKILKIC